MYGCKRAGRSKNGKLLIMRGFNLFYVVILLVGGAIWWLHQSLSQPVVEFYGFAENKETEINFNYPVVVEKILVSPGAYVEEGALLVNAYRVKSKETLEEAPFKIRELRARAENWRSNRQGEMATLQRRRDLVATDFDQRLNRLQTEQSFQSDLFDDLTTVSGSGTDERIAARLDDLRQEKQLELARLDQELANLERELQTGLNPYAAQIDQLAAEQAFNESTKKIAIELRAPREGLVGNIYCKEAEHIPAFKTLLSFYEPHPSLVKGYVQEDLILHVSPNDTFRVRSTKNSSLTYSGVITGLGSRIVEIPERLRKMTDLKTYGREVLVEIPTNNQFLQKEKVILEFLNPPQDLPTTPYRRPLVEQLNLSE